MRHPATAVLPLAAALLSATLPVAPAGATAPEHRHGSGRLTMTFQGPVLTIDMVLPAADIVGFEHPPATDEDHTDIAQAKAAFQDPAQAVALPVGAGCAVDRAETEFAPLPAGMDAAKAARADGPHAVFSVLYEMSCAEPRRLTGVSFPLFGLYPTLSELQVRLVAGDAHRDVTVTRDRPRLDLTR